jgi:hypothetical protein
MSDKAKVFLAEHILEIRHEASGNFLDVRGRIADYCKKQKLFPHWQIDNQVINFRDSAEKIGREGAFVSYKNFGYIVLDAPTMNYFPDRAIHFLKVLSQFKDYQPENFLRFGARTKFFIPSDLSFEEISKKMSAGVFSEKLISLVGGAQADLQFIIELKEEGFDIRIVGGPLHKDEAKNFMQFESKEFAKTGVFFDVDFYKTDNLNSSQFNTHLKTSIGLTWGKIEKIASGLGF